MALPGREKTFGLEGCRCLLAKLEWEINRLKDTPPNDADSLMYGAFNAAVTAWHIADWAWADMSEDQKDCLRTGWQADLELWGITLRDGGNFLHALRKKNRDLAICREIATASKHVEVTQHPDPTIDTAVSASDSRVLSNGGETVTDINDQFVTVPRFVLKVSDGAERRPFLEVLDGTLKFWTEFIYPRNIDR